MDISERLRRLGVVRGAGHLTPRPPEPAPPGTSRRSLERLIPGRISQNDWGEFFLVEETFPISHRHGSESLQALLDHSGELFARFTGNPALAELDLSRAAFIDTETTGLAGGTGTYAFLIGVGYFEGDAFRLQQFFMRDYDEEPALLHHLAETFDALQGIVSFNGRAFDLPLLETRFLLSRLRPDLLDAPHLDLLHPARRIWKSRLPSCALSSLEANVLDVHRDGRDVPGMLIPYMYFRFLETSDASEISRIFYHNAQDILSLVTLTSRLAALYQATSRGQPAEGQDLFSVGRLCESLGLTIESEQVYLHALNDSLLPSVRAEIEQHLSLLYKRTGRWEEAIVLWEGLRASAHSGIFAHIELAKYHEHHARNYEYALTLVLQARERWPSAYTLNPTLAELDHRIDRLHRKLANQSNLMEETGESD